MNIPNEKNDDIFNNIPYNQVTTNIPPLPFNIMNFLNWSDESISMFTLTLRRDDEAMADEIIITIFDLFNYVLTPTLYMKRLYPLI